MMFYYIHDDEFITTDTELSGYDLGEQKLEDYKNGKYILLNPNQIEFMEANPKASPLEVFLCQLLGPKVPQFQTAMQKWFYENAEKVRINGQLVDKFDWRNLLQEVWVYKQAGREEVTFTIWGKKYKSNTDTIYNFLIQYAIFCYDLEKVREEHYNYIELHPEDENYDYTVGVPQILSINLEEL